MWTLFKTAICLTMIITMMNLIDLVASSPLSPRACGTIIRPTNFYRISSRTPDLTENYGPFFDGHFEFDLRQTGDGKAIQEENDIIATYTNVPCGHNPYKIEFLFEPQSDYGYSYSTRVDLFALKGKLPRNSTGAGVPTWNNLRGRKAGKVGSWTMPNDEVSQTRRTYKIGQVTCTKEINLCASITDDGYPSGLVLYPQQYAGVDSGLRVRYRC